MITTIKLLGKLSAVYTIADIVTTGIGFILIPLYTRFLTPSDYGIIAISNVVSVLISMLLSFGTYAVVMRFYHQTELDRKRFFGAWWMFLIIVPGVIIVCLEVFGNSIFKVLFTQIPFHPFIELTLWTGYLQVAFFQIPQMLFRAREQARKYVALSLLSFFSSTALTIWLVVLRHQGALGSVQARLFGAIIVASVAIGILLRETTPNLGIKYIWSALGYGTPMVPHYVSHWALSVSDRAILERYVSLGQVGIYSLSYQVGSLCKIVFTAVNSAMQPSFGRAAHSSGERTRLARLVTYYFAIVFIVGLAVALFGGEMIALVTPKSYHAAGELIPWVVLGMMAMGFASVSENVLTLLAGKTQMIPVVALASASVNVGLNLFLVPHYGVLAAACDIIAGYGTLAFLLALAARRAVMFPYEVGRLLKLGLSFLILFVLGRIAMRFDTVINLAIGLFALLLYPMLLYVSGFFNESEFRFLQRRSSRLFARFRTARS